MKAEKSHNLPSPIERPMKVGGAVQTPESQAANGVDFSPRLKARELGAPRAGDHYPSSAIRQKKRI